MHGDHAEDHEKDHAWSHERGLTGAAEVLLCAVADSDERSVELAGALARAVLEGDIVRRARQLEELLRTRSPFALVRAVELAERLLTTTGDAAGASPSDTIRRRS